MISLDINGLGLTATSNRNIKPGTQYEKYFDTTQLVRSDKVVLTGTTFDTLEQMARIVRRTLDDTKPFSATIKGRNLMDTCLKIWQFIYDHIDYVEDDQEFEELRRPLRTWADRKGDCDCYSIFISSILTNLNIDHAYRMAGYKGDFQHVYVIVPIDPDKSLDERNNYIVIDPVADNFNYEVPYSKKFDKQMKMQIKYLNGLGDLQDADTIQPSYTYPYGFEFASYGINGLGYTDNAVLLAEDFVNRLQLHLINTHKKLSSNPIPGGELLADQINQVLRVWEDPTLRDVLINQFSTHTQLSGINGFFDKIGEALNKIGPAIQKGTDAIKQVAAESGYTIIRTNPVTTYTNPQIYRPQQPQTYQLLPDGSYLPGSKNNTNTWLLLGGLGLATILVVNAKNKYKPQTKKRTKVSGTHTSTGTSGRPKSRKRQPSTGAKTLVMG